MSDHNSTVHTPSSSKLNTPWALKYIRNKKQRIKKKQQQKRQMYNKNYYQKNCKILKHKSKIYYHSNKRQQRKAKIKPRLRKPLKLISTTKTNKTNNINSIAVKHHTTIDGSDHLHDFWINLKEIDFDKEIHIMIQTNKKVNLNKVHICFMQNNDNFELLGNIIKI